MSFLEGYSNRLIVVDKEGNLSDFEISLGNEQRYVIYPLQNQLALKGPEHQVCHAEALMHQFSGTGDVLASVYCKPDTHHPSAKNTVIGIYNFRTNPVKKITMTFRIATACVPLLSKNGNSLLVLFPAHQKTRSISNLASHRGISGVRVIPQLDFTSHEQSDVKIPGDRAFWGLDGEYLLGWDLNNSMPRLSVYETESLSSNQNKGVIPLCQKTLRPGLTYWKALMLRASSPNSHHEVLIYEMSAERRVFTLWDIEQDTVTREVKMVLSPGGTADKMHFALNKSASLRPRTRRPPTAEDLFIFSALDDVFPDFCASADGNWIGAVSWIDQTVGMSSVRWGVTSWSTIFANDLLAPPLMMANEVQFDAAEHHLLVFGEELIQAFAPSFLNEKFAVGRHIKEFHQNLTSLNTEPCRQSLLDAYQCLPSKALCKAWEIGASTHRVRLAWFRSRREVYKGQMVIDSALSSDNTLLALIVRGLRGTSCVSMRDACCSDVEDDDVCANLRFPMHIAGRAEKFTPERIFLFQGQGGEQFVALFASGQDPIAVFYGVDDESIVVVNLGMTTCLKICKRKESNDVLLLDEDAVCILSLQKQRIIDRRPFKSNIRSLLQTVNASSKWRRPEYKTQKEPHSEQCISAEGDAILLAWDTENKRSIVITPAMRQVECEALIKEAEGSLSECCMLSASGDYTLFLDVDELSRGRITVGMFYERGNSTLA